MAVTNSGQNELASKMEMSASSEGPHVSDSGQYSWTNEQALQLITFYKDYINSNINDRSKKTMWEHIAAQMEDVGYVDCTAYHCSTKYKSMARQYRIVTENNVVPGNKKRSCFFYDALSEVYGYVPVIYKPGEIKLDDDGTSCSSSPTSKSLMSTIIDLNDDDEEQEQERLDKMEAMHQEKVEMFSAFLKSVPISDNDRQVSQKRNIKHKIAASKKHKYQSDCEENIDDLQEGRQSDAFDVSRTLDIDLDLNEVGWSEPWSRETSDAFVNLLQEHRSMWIDPSCKIQSFWELVASGLKKETGKSFDPQEVEKYFKILTEKYRNVIHNNSKSGAKLITCVYFKELHELFSYNPNGWYKVSKSFIHSQPRVKRERGSNPELLTLLKRIHSERKEEEQRKLERLKRMHDDKMTIFSSLMNVLKKMKQ